MVLIQTRERIIVERDTTLELSMQVATLMVLRTLGLLRYTTSSQSSLRPSLRAICGNRLRQGRRNASNPRCACAVAVGCGLGRRFCGQASVIDGDTLEIHGTRIRLFWGIDAPERQLAMPRRGQLSIPPRRAGRKRPRHLHRPAPGQLCSEWLVRNGLALDWPQYSKGKYGEAQRDAERLAEESGRAAISSHGCIGRASGWATLRPTARTTPTPIPDRPP